MTEETAASTVARLDRDKPPPGYEVYGAFDGGWWFSPVGFDPDVGDEGFALYDFAKAAAWEHYEAQHDPSGMSVVAVLQGDAFLVRGPGDVALDDAGMWATRERARAAAWAWYWRRVDLMTRMLAAVTSVYGAVWGDEEHLWPSVLTWPDRQVDDVLALLRGEVRRG